MLARMHRPFCSRRRRVPPGLSPDSFQVLMRKGRLRTHCAAERQCFRPDAGLMLPLAKRPGDGVVRGRRSEKRHTLTHTHTNATSIIHIVGDGDDEMVRNVPCERRRACVRTVRLIQRIIVPCSFGIRWLKNLRSEYIDHSFVELSAIILFRK